MTSANDGYNGGAGGKLRKKVLRKTTPYDQPITNPNPKNTSKSSFFSRLIYAVTCAFWRRNPAVTEAPVTGTNEEQRNLRYISSATEISDIETMLKKRLLPGCYILIYEIEHLTTYRYEIDEGDKANISKNSLVLRLKESKSGPLNKHAEERENLHAVISIPRDFQVDVASPIEIARGRSSGKTAILRTCFAGFQPTQSLISSQPAWELEGSNGSKMAGKRRSSVQDDLGYGGPMRRIRQKAKRCSQGSSLSKHKSEFDSSAQRLLLSSEPEQKASKAIVENGEISMRNSGYAFVPTVSTQMASKIFEHLERTIPKEKPLYPACSKTKKSATKLTSYCQLGSRDKVEYHQDFEVSDDDNHSTAPTVNGNAPTTNAPSTLALPTEPPQKKPAFQMSAPEDFEVSDDDNHSTTPTVKGNAPTTNAASTLALPAEPSQKKQMSAHEVFEVLDDDNHSTAPVQGNASTTNAVSTWSLRGYDDPPKKKLRNYVSEGFRFFRTVSSFNFRGIKRDNSSNDDEVAEKVNKLAMAVMDSIDLMAEADPDFPNHGLVCIPQYFGVNAEPLASPNKRPFSPLALMQQSSPSES
ncbi:hypothetical protein Tco_1541923 [Tanacetum coccineum]